MDSWVVSGFGRLNCEQSQYKPYLRTGFSFFCVSRSATAGLNGECAFNYFKLPNFFLKWYEEYSSPASSPFVITSYFSFLILAILRVVCWHLIVVLSYIFAVIRWDWESFYVLTWNLSIFSDEVCLQIFCPFISLIFFLLLPSERVLYISWILAFIMLRYVFCKYFLHVRLFIFLIMSF